jgi:hypothetical protein
MAKERAYDPKSGPMSDVRVVRELFEGDVTTIARINRAYLAPRDKALKGKPDVERDHFLKPKGAAVVGDVERMMVQAKLEGLGKVPLNQVGISVAAAFCGVSEPELKRLYGRYDTKEISGLHILEQDGKSGLANLQQKGEIVLANAVRTAEIALADEEQKDKLGLANALKAAKLDLAQAVKKAAIAAAALNAKSATGGKTQKASVGNRGWRWFRMDAVVEMSKLPSKKKSKAARPVVATPAAALGIPITLKSANYDNRYWVCNGEGQAVANLIFNSLSPVALYGFLTNGGSIKRMTVREAIEHEWATVSDRKAWVDGYMLLLKREGEAMEKTTKTHNAIVERRIMEVTLPAAPPAKRKRPFAVDD